MAIVIKLVVGLLLGAAVGAMIGKSRTCETGACPLTASPVRGAMFGGVIGLMLAMGFAGSAVNSPSGEEASGDSTIQHVTTQAELDVVLGGAAGPVLIDFYATWCPPCKKYGPILEKVARENPSAVIIKVDVDKARELADAYGIEGVPTTVIAQQGKETARMVGLQSEQDVKSALGL